jgi:dynein heavy chain
LPADFTLQEGTVFEYSFDKESCSWVHWMAGLGNVSISESLAFTDIVVPTIDTVRYSHIMQLLVSHNKHLLFVGPTGMLCRPTKLLSG